MPDFDAFVRLYDADYASFEDDLDLYLPLAVHVDGPILEAMCGTGRVMLPLASAGHAVTGIDLSAAMVDAANIKLAAAGCSNAHALIGDTRTFDLPDRFALAIIAMNSFMHLENVADQLQTLRRIHHHLKPGGILVLDLFNPDPRELLADEGLLVHARTFPSGDLTVQKYVLRRTDVATQMHYVEFVYDEWGPDRVLRRSVLPFTMRWLYRYELEHLLVLAGFEMDTVYGSYDLDPYASESDRLIAVARVPAAQRPQRKRPTAR
ncbi:MAG: class I SAM-dependent methyltransferase [Herpetosiphon sp.]